MNSSNPNLIDDSKMTAAPISKLKHPTAYHLQQQQSRYKDMDFAPAPTFLPPQQQHQHQHHQYHTNDSPHLSDIDYAELTSPLHTDYMPYSDAPEAKISTPTQNGQYYGSPHRRSMDQEYIYDDQSIDSAFAFNPSEHMRRAESNEDRLTKLAQPLSASSSNQDFMFYPHPSALDQRFKQFAVSAPVDITYKSAHHPSAEGENLPEDGGGMVMMMGPSSASGDGGNFGYSVNPRSESRSLEEDYAAQVK